MHSHERELQFSQDVHDLALHRQSFSAWRERCLNDEERSPVEIFFQCFGEALTPLLHFLADGMKQGSFGERAWVLLYCVRPDLLNGTTQQFAARKFGFGQATLSQLVQDFERRFPGLAVSANRNAWTMERKERWLAARARNRRLARGDYRPEDVPWDFESAVEFLALMSHRKRERAS